MCISIPIYKAMKVHMKTDTQLWKYRPYIQVLLELCFQSHLHHYSDSAEVDSHKERLKNYVSAWNFSLISVQTDGKCFFTSFSLALVQDISTGKPIFGVDVKGSISVLVERSDCSRMDWSE